MEQLSEAEREWLGEQAQAQAKQNKSSAAIVDALRQYSQAHGIKASDGELFVIADLARAQKPDPVSSNTAQAPKELVPRKLKDRRLRDRRRAPGRSADRRRTGLEATVEALRRVGQPERRSGRDRRAARDRRELIRRRRIRRLDER